MKTIIFLTLILFAGCTTHRFIKTYKVESFTLYVADLDTVEKEREKLSRQNIQVSSARWGFCNPSNRTIWVMAYTKHHPVLKVFGREACRLQGFRK